MTASQGHRSSNTAKHPPGPGSTSPQASLLTLARPERPSSAGMPSAPKIG